MMNIKPKPKLNPCPFCNSENCESQWREEYGQNQVVCLECGGCGPLQKSTEKAENSWHSRFEFEIEVVKMLYFFAEEKKNWAELHHIGFLIESKIEDLLDETIPWLEKISSDYYDNSLEVYSSLEKNSIENFDSYLEPLKELVWSMGFSRFWINFPVVMKEHTHELVYERAKGNELHFVKPQ